MGYRVMAWSPNPVAGGSSSSSSAASVGNRSVIGGVECEKVSTPQGVFWVPFVEGVDRDELGLTVQERVRFIALCVSKADIPLDDIEKASIERKDSWLGGFRGRGLMPWRSGLKWMERERLQRKDHP